MTIPGCIPLNASSSRTPSRTPTAPRSLSRSISAEAAEFSVRTRLISSSILCVFPRLPRTFTGSIPISAPISCPPSPLRFIRISSTSPPSSADSAARIAGASSTTNRRNASIFGGLNGIWLVSHRARPHSMPSSGRPARRRGWLDGAGGAGGRGAGAPLSVRPAAPALRPAALPHCAHPPVASRLAAAPRVPCVAAP